jgi:hypothetical protein
MNTSKKLNKFDDRKFIHKLNFFQNLEENFPLRNFTLEKGVSLGSAWRESGSYSPRER